jgi:hypothetical protein
LTRAPGNVDTADASNLSESERFLIMELMIEPLGKEIEQQGYNGPLFAHCQVLARKLGFQLDRLALQ